MATSKRPSIGRQVRDRRIMLGYSTQRDAALAADVSTTTWNELEAGRRIPKSRRVQDKITRLLGWAPGALEEPTPSAGAGPVEPAAGPLSLELGRLADELRSITEMQQETNRRLDRIDAALDGLNGNGHQSAS